MPTFERPAWLTEAGRFIFRHGRKCLKGRDAMRRTGSVFSSVAAIATKVAATVFASILILSAAAMAQANREAQELYNRGRDRYGKGQVHDAIDDYTRAIALISLPTGDQTHAKRKLKLSFGQQAERSPAIALLDPLAAAIYADRSLARYTLGDFEGAMADSNQAIAIDPGLGTAYADRGQIRSVMGDPAGAIADLSKAIAIDPTDYQSYNNRGGVFYKKGDVDGALVDFDRAIALNPRVAEIYANRAMARTDKEDFDGAIADTDRAIKLNPRLALAFYVRGTARFVRKEIEGSISDFSRAVELDPGFVDAYANRGLVWLMLGQDSKAREDFARCLRLDPSAEAELQRHIQAAKQHRIEIR